MVQTGAGYQVFLTRRYFLFHMDGLCLLTPPPVQGYGCTTTSIVPSVTEKLCTTDPSSQGLLGEVLEASGRLKWVEVVKEEPGIPEGT